MLLDFQLLTSIYYLRSCSDQCRIAMYHTPHLRGLYKRFVPPRWNETIGIAIVCSMYRVPISPGLLIEFGQSIFVTFLFLLCFSLFSSTTSRALIQQCSVTPQKFFAPTRILEALKMLFDLRNRSLTEIFFVFTSIILESFNYFIFTLLYFIIGLQHCKIYIFDDSVIISGANLSHDYFTNRQVSILCLFQIDR